MIRRKGRGCYVLPREIRNEDSCCHDTMHCWHCDLVVQGFGRRGHRASE